MVRVNRTLCMLAAIFTLVVTIPLSAYGQSSPSMKKELVDAAWQPESLSQKLPSSTIERAPTIAETSPGIGSWGRMVAVSFSEGNSEIYLYTATPQGTLTQNLSNNRAEDVEPRLNPSADHVAFVSNRSRNRDIYRMAVSGAQLVQLTATPEDEAQPFWSPDGKRIVFTSKRDGNWNLYVMNADGGAQTRLTADGAHDIMPSWSPDGSKIAWVRVGGASGAIWLMNADGSNQRAISAPMAYLQHPHWSSDSARLVFDYDRDGDGFNELGIINVDGSGMQPLSVTTTASSRQRADLAAAAWAPGDEWLVLGVFIYDIAGGKATISNAYVAGVATSGGGLSLLGYPALQADPDLRSLDLAAPTTQLERLPAQTRGDNILVRWSGQDRGLAGGLTYDVQYRTDESGPWKDWQRRVTATEAKFTGALGATVAFRIRGRDAAGNTEAWQTAADTATTFYTWRVVGQITDSRGRPVPNAQLNASPNVIGTTATNIDGRYRALLAGGGSHIFSTGTEGFAAPPATTLAADRDRVFSAYLPPSDDLLQNGSFEASGEQLSGWTVGGTLPVAPATAAHTGARAARLGQVCPSPCLSDEQVIPAVGPNEPPPTLQSLAADATHAVHLLWRKSDGSAFFGGPEISYQKRTPEGTWNVPTKIGNGSWAIIAVDGNQTLHVAWVSSQYRLLYREQPAGGAWSEPQDLGLANRVQLVADTQGRVYAFYYCASVPGCPNTGEGVYRVREANGTWQPEHTLPAPATTAAVGPNNTVRVVWHQAGAGYVATVRPDGGLSSETQFSDATYQPNQPKVVVDAHGYAHIVWHNGQDIYYTQELPDGTFTLPTSMAGGDPTLTEAQGILYLVTTPNNPNTSGISVRTKVGDGEWSEPTLLHQTAHGQALLTTDQRGRPHLVRSGSLNTAGWTQLVYQTNLLSSQAGQATIEQTVTLPAAMHKPTLAFDYLLVGGEEGGSQITVSLSDATRIRNELVTHASGGWGHAAVDLSPWANTTVTVTISLSQAANAPPAMAVIDDVSLGSWQTPVVEGVSKAAIETIEPTEITIFGDNFLATPTVLIGTTALTNVQRLDEHTLKATVPAGLKPGQYLMWVTNPGGQRAAGPVVTAGHMVYFPSAQR